MEGKWILTFKTSVICVFIMFAFIEFFIKMGTIYTLQSLENKEDAETPAESMKGPATRNADVTAPAVTQKTKRSVTRNSDETEDMNVNDSKVGNK